MNISLLFISPLEYTITMYDTKSRELRWNATYSDYASTLPDDDTKYSKILGTFVCFIALVSNRLTITRLLFSFFCLPQRWLILCPMATALW